MEDVKIRPYVKKFTHSYAFGVYPTIELLTYRPKEVVKVMLHSRGKQNEGVIKIIEMCKKLGIRTETSDGLIEKLSLAGNTYAVGVFKKYKTVLDIGSDQLVLVNPEDTGNLGTVIRTALGFGVKNIAVIKPAVDVFDPKTVRASMGSVFQANVEYFEDFLEYRIVHKNTCYLFMVDGQNELSKIGLVRPFSLVFGSESEGLPEEYRNYGNTVFIKQSKVIDSLNLSMAAGLALYKSYLN